MRRSHPLISATAIFTMGFLYLPLVAVAVFSVNATRYGLVWKGFTLDWYLKLIQNEFILEAAWNTLVLAVVSTLVATVLGTILAIGMDRFPWSRRTNTFLDLVLHIPVVIPDIILAAALVVRSRLVTIGRDVEEAARDLFASTPYLLWRVTLPLLLPGIVAGAMLAFTLSLDDFVISFFTAGPDSVTLPLFIFAAVRRGVTPQIHALSTLVVLITVVMIIGMERFTRK